MTTDKFGDWANGYGWWTWLVWGNMGPWHVAARCRECGAGYEWGKPGDPPTDTTSNARWLCSECGAGVDKVVKWVGRKRARHAYVSQGYIWEWLPAEKLPLDLRPDGLQTAFERAVYEEVARRLPKLLDEEFERRVQAAVEVELAQQQHGRRAE